LPNNGPSFTWDPGTLLVATQQIERDIGALIATVVDFSATKAEAHMKTGAKWTDRTGNARQTLRAAASHAADLSWHEIKLFGGMPYQVWLEIRWGGRYAIIGPSIPIEGREMMKRLNGLITRLKK
jgi:hypothetical protein